MATTFLPNGSGTTGRGESGKAGKADDPLALMMMRLWARKLTELMLLSLTAPLLRKFDATIALRLTVHGAGNLESVQEWSSKTFPLCLCVIRSSGILFVKEI